MNSTPSPSFLFGPDGTLVDSVYRHVLARHEAQSYRGIGPLSGGLGADELERAGAFRVYEDPGDLPRHLDEVGVRRD
ncbi:MAG: hypothetical protein ACKVOI_12635 [Dongiaceae bacterium]